MAARLPPVVTELRVRIEEDGLTDHSAALAFWTFLAIFPVAIAFVAMLGTMESVIGSANAQKVRDEVIERLDRVLAAGQMEELRTTIIDILTTPRTGLAIVAIGAALWSMSKGFGSLCRALARIHGQPEARRGLVGRFWGGIIGGGTLLLGTLAIAQFVLGPTFGIGNVEGDTIVRVWNVVRVPLLVGVVYLWLLAVLKVGPGLPGSLRRFGAGALTTLVLLMVLAAGAALIVRFGLVNANPVLGALGGVLLLMTVLKLLAQAILIGGEVNDLRFRPERPRAAVPVGGAGEEVGVDRLEEG